METKPLDPFTDKPITGSVALTIREQDEWSPAAEEVPLPSGVVPPERIMHEGMIRG